jgi:hypothetical protein
MGRCFEAGTNCGISFFYFEYSDFSDDEIYWITRFS